MILFKVCLFNVESGLGKGSRFYFRLPAGIRKSVSCCSLCCLCACHPAGMLWNSLLPERCYRVLWHCLHRMNTKLCWTKPPIMPMSLLLQCRRRIRTGFTIHRFGNVLPERTLQAIRPSYTSLYDADGRRGACGTGLVEPDVQFGFPCNSGYQE